MTDDLGSIRVVTDLNGNIISRHDYLAFGEEAIADGNRPAGDGFGLADGVSERFTGKERDSETGLDYFGARYYGSALGRFTSADDGSDQDPGDPQSWNLYGYGRNNPLRFTDPDGHDAADSDDPCHGNPNCVTVTDKAPGLSTVDALLYRSLFNVVQQSMQVQQVGQQVFNWLSQPRNGTCLAASTAAGASAGAGVGMLGLAGGPAVGITEPTAMAIGGGIGWAGGMISCMSGSGTSGGTSSGSGSGQNKVRFGNNPNQEYHTFGHVEEAGIDKQAAEQAIRSDLAGNESTLSQGLTTRQVSVSGKTLQYTAFKLADGTINVGRITVH